MEYQHLFNSDIGALLLKRDQNVIHLLLFSIESKRIKILNTYFHIEAQYIDFACTILFKNYFEIKEIVFYEIYQTIFSTIKNPHYIFRLDNDTVIHLPESFDEYFSNLGKKTRHHMKQYIKKLNKKSDLMKFEVISGNKFNSNYFNELIRLNKTRMDRKGLKPYYNELQEQKWLRYTKESGHISVISNSDAIIAGMIFFIIGTNCHVLLIAHNDKFSKYDPGLVCLLHTIKYCIELNVRTVHMGPSTYEYKHRFQGKDKSFYSCLVYRSYFNNSTIQVLLKVFLVDLYFYYNQFEKEVLTNTRVKCALALIRHRFGRLLNRLL